MTPAKKASSTSRYRRVKIIAYSATLLSFIFTGALSVISFADASRHTGWQLYADGGVLAAMAICCLVGFFLGIKKRIRRTIFLMIYSIMAAMTVRVLLIAGLGIEFGVIVTTATTVVALLSLSSQSASRVNTIGLELGSTLVILDIIWPFSRAAATPLATLTALSAAILFGIVYLGFTLVQFRRFSLYSKILLGITLAALVPAIAVGALSNQLTRSTLSTNTYQILNSSAKQTTFTISDFVTTNLDAVRSEAQIPALRDYLLSLQATPANNVDYAGNASNVLRALIKKDELFIESYALLNQRGIVMLDTDAAGVSATETQYEYFTYPLNAGLPYVSPMLVSPENKPYIVFSSPIRNPAGSVIGVLRVRYKGMIIQRIVAQQNNLAGEESYALILDENNIIIANGSSPDLTLKTLTTVDDKELASLQSKQLLPNGMTAEELSIHMPELQQNLAANKNNFIFNLAHGDTTSRDAGAFADMQQPPWRVVFLQNANAFLGPAQKQTESNTLLAAIVIFLAAVGASAVARVLTAPIQRLTATSEQIALGNLNLKAKVETEDEIGSLANAFNSMTSKLNETIESLEARVEERTRVIERRALLMQAATEVGRNAASLRDRNALLSQTTRLISQRFGYYHAGIFLIEERGEYAVLQAANSEGGQRMLRRGHRLKVGQTGIVGFVTGRGQARIALDVGEDATYFNNPDLPKTRSEMALPLIASGRILGALDVQSELPNAFTEEDIATLQVMADQIAIAIENTRLFEESQAALDSARRAYGEVSHKGWQQLMQTRKTELGYISLPENRIVPASGATSPEYTQAIKSGRPTLTNNKMTLYVPVKTREEVIGAIRLDKPENGIQWTDKDIETARALSEQLGTARESARLYNESSERAEREAAISDITAKIGASIQIDTILRTTVQELGKALSETEVVLQLGNTIAKGKRRE